MARTALIRVHTELGDGAIYFAIPVAVLALLIWWRDREANPSAHHDDAKGIPSGDTMTAVRTAPRIPRPVSSTVTATIAVLAAGAAVYDVYRIGDSGAQAAWQGHFSPTPTPQPPRSPGNGCW